jgi:hypothetical protein
MTMTETPGKRTTTIAKRTWDETGTQQSPQNTEEGPSPHGDPHAKTQTGEEATVAAKAGHGESPGPGPHYGEERDQDLLLLTPKTKDNANVEIATGPKAEGETEAPTTGMFYAN